MTEYIVQVRTYIIGYYRFSPIDSWKDIVLSGRWRVQKIPDKESVVTFEDSDGVWHSAEELRIVENFINECYK